MDFDIPSISATIAAVGVLVGVVIAVVELRNLVKQRQTDLVTRLYSQVTSKEFLEAWEKVRDREIKDYSDYKKNYGFLEFNQVVDAYEEVGVLLRRRLIDIELVNALFAGGVITVWEKAKPVVEVVRKKEWWLHYMEGFEYLYKEMKKREQQLEQSKAKADD